jgi:S-adenosylmethionine hydrolase
VITVDRFGNIELDLRRSHLEQLDMTPGTRVELDLPLERYYAVVARTFADARPGEIIVYEDAYWGIAVAINGGSAAETLSVRAGDELRIRRL